MVIIVMEVQGIDMNNSDFVEQFSTLSKELPPLMMNIIEENDIGDSVVLFYLASVVKEILKGYDSDGVKEAVFRFMVDE